MRVDGDKIIVPTKYKSM